MSYSELLRPNSRYQNRWSYLQPINVSPDPVRRSMGANDTECPICKIVYDARWASKHLASRTHRLMSSLSEDAT